MIQLNGLLDLSKLNRSNECQNLDNACEDRFAETNGYEGFQEDKQKLLDIYNRIKPTWEDHGQVGVDDDATSVPYKL